MCEREGGREGGGLTDGGQAGLVSAASCPDEVLQRPSVQELQADGQRAVQRVGEHLQQLHDERTLLDARDAGQENHSRTDTQRKRERERDLD